MKIRLFITFTFFSIQIFAQKQNILGKILDIRTKQPIAYASFFYGNNIVLSDSIGMYHLQNIDLDKDLVRIEALGYENFSISAKLLAQKPIIELEELEDIEKIVIKAKKVKIKRQKIGHFKEGIAFPLLKNIHFSMKAKWTSLSYIPNEKQEEGFIERVHIKFYHLKNAYKIDPLTKEKYRFSDPEWVKIRIRCISFDERTKKPFKDLITEDMIFIIKRYNSQWFDISSFCVPFPKNGVFVGFQLIDYAGKDGISNISFPIFTKNNISGVPDYRSSINGWLPFKAGFFNIAAEVSFVK